jgi:hypothetical protein
MARNKGRYGSTRPEKSRAGSKQNGKKISFPERALPHSMLLTFTKYDYSNVFNKLNNRTSDDSKPDGQPLMQQYVELPFPKNLSNQTGLRVETFGKSVFAESAANKMLDISQSPSANDVGTKLLNTTNAAAGGLQSFGKGLSNFNGISGDLATAVSYALSIFGRNNYASTIESTVGRTVNPKESLVFTGVDLKSYSFVWQLFPNSRRESAIINDIIKTIKSNVLPTTRNFGGFNKALLAYPSTVEAQLIGVDEEFFFHFKPAIVSAFNVDYGSSDTVPIMEGGKPAAVTITLEFTELQSDDAGVYEDVFGEPEIAGSFIPTVNDAEEST